MIVSIINSDGKLLYLALRSAITELPEGHIIVEKICKLESESDIFFNFETQQFYLKND